MANYYPKARPTRDFPGVGLPANDNYRKRVVFPPEPANDNRPGGGRPSRQARPQLYLRRSPLGDVLGGTQAMIDAAEAMEHLLYFTAATQTLNMAGWSPAGACRTGREDVIGTWTSCARPFSPGIINPGAVIPGSRTQIMTMTRDNAVAGRPYLPVRIYTRQAQSQPQPNPWRVTPRVNVPQIPLVSPRPEDLPIAAPGVVPFPRPARALGRAPTFRMGVQVRGNHAPGARPSPGSNVRPSPPGKGVKEQKFALAIPGVANQMLGWLTEGLDAFHAVYGALPQWFRDEHRHANGAERAMLLYENFHLVDPSQALWNLLSEQGKDRYYAAWGRLTAKANRRRGMPGGLALGPAL